MSIEQCKRIAYDLALEYIKQHSALSDVESNIPKMTNNFIEIYQKFYETLIKSEKAHTLF